MLLQAVLILIAVRATINATWAVFVVSIFSRGPKISERNTSTSIVLVLPVLREEARIRESINYIRESIDSGYISSCIIVGTIRERDKTLENRTLELARSAIAAHPSFVVMECPLEEGGKAHQVNFALQSYRSTTSNDPLLLLIDIDSEFGGDVLAEISREPLLQFAWAQQHAVFLKNYSSLPFIQRCHALYQSRWTLSHEVKNLYLNRWLSFWCYHIVTHGLFIKLSTLETLGGIPESTVTEDIQLGYYLSALALKVRSLRSLELADTPDTLKAALKQQRQWAFGPMQYLLYKRNFRRELPAGWDRHKIRATVLAWQGLLTYWHWLFLLPSLFLTITFAALGSLSAQLALSAYFVELTLCSWLFWSKGWIPARDALAGGLLMMIHVPIRCAAAWRAGFYALTHTKLSWGKTINRKPT